VLLGDSGACQSVNQSCIIRVVQVTKITSGSTGRIFYRGSMIMSGNEAWNRNVYNNNVTSGFYTCVCVNNLPKVVT